MRHLLLLPAAGNVVAEAVKSGDPVVAGKRSGLSTAKAAVATTAAAAAGGISATVAVVSEAEHVLPKNNPLDRGSLVPMRAAKPSGTIPVPDR